MKKPKQKHFSVSILLIFIFLVSCHREKNIKINANCLCHDLLIGEGLQSIQKKAPGFEEITDDSVENPLYKLSDDCDIDSTPVDEEITATIHNNKVITISAEYKSEKPLPVLINLLKDKYKDRFKLAKSSEGNYYTTYDYIDSTYYFFYKIPRTDTSNYVIKYEIGFRDAIIKRIPNPDK